MSSSLQNLFGRLARVPPTTRLGRLLRSPLGIVPRRLCLPILAGPLRGARWITGSASHGCWLGSYEVEIQRVLWSVISSGDVVYDVGANVGFHTLLASRRVGTRGRVYAFEPLARNLEFLERHIAMNGLNNIEVMKLALADSAGREGFRADHPAMGRLSHDSSLSVETAALDGLLEQGRIEPPSLIKIDVEGAEGRVLTGALHCIETHRPVMVLAIHGDSARRECSALLTAREYRLRGLDGPSLATSSEILADPAPAGC